MEGGAYMDYKYSLFNDEKTGWIRENLMEEYYSELCEFETDIYNNRINVFKTLKEDYHNEEIVEKELQLRKNKKENVKKRWLEELPRRIRDSYREEVSINEAYMIEDMSCIIDILISDNYQEEIKKHEREHNVYIMVDWERVSRDKKRNISEIEAELKRFIENITMLTMQKIFRNEMDGRVNYIVVRNWDDGILIDFKGDICIYNYIIELIKLFNSTEIVDKFKEIKEYEIRGRKIDEV